MLVVHRALAANFLGAFLLVVAACSGGGGSSALPPASTPTPSTAPNPGGTPWNPTIQEFAVPSGHDPTDITVGADGDLWFTEVQSHLIGRMTTSGTLVAEYTVPNATIGLSNIALGSDGNVWFTDFQGDFVAKVTTNGTITETNLPPNTQPASIFNGPDNNLWFATSTGFGKLAPSSMTFTYYNPAMTNSPSALTTGPDGNIWFGESPGGRVGHISTSGTNLQEFPLTTPTADPAFLAAGSDGNIWVTEGGNPLVGPISQVGRFTLSGKETDYQTPTSNAGMGVIISAPNGYLYATESLVGNIARITPTNGHIDEASLPSGSQSGPGSIVLGPDGNLWFTERGASKIGRLIPP